ncbi:MAG: hypothetical protein CL714_00445 [Chloroflexi bacterium]|nr:hypothetical protein [Chloroflexota bacterium]
MINSKSKKLFLIFPLIIIFLTFITWRFVNFEWDRVLDNIQSIHIGKYILAGILYYLSFIFRGFRWKIIAKEANIDNARGKNIPSTLKLSGIILIGWFANSVAFMRVGDLYRGILLSKESKSSLSMSLGTIFAERIQDMISVSILIVISITIIAFTGSINPPDWILIFVITTLVIIIFTLLIMKILGKQLSIILPAKIRDFYLNFQKAALDSFSKKTISPQLLLGITGWVLEILRFGLVASALGIDIAIGIIILFTLVGAILTTIPTPGGFGFVEGGLTGLLIVFGINNYDSITLVAIDRTISWASIIIFGGLLFLVWNTVKSNKGDLSDLTNKKSSI